MSCPAVFLPTILPISSFWQSCRYDPPCLLTSEVHVQYNLIFIGVVVWQVNCPFQMLMVISSTMFLILCHQGWVEQTGQQADTFAEPCVNFHYL